MPKAINNSIAPAEITATAYSGRSAVEYLQSEIAVYAEQPIEQGDAYDTGYRDALISVLADVYGIEARVSYEFAPSGTMTISPLQS